MGLNSRSTLSDDIKLSGDINNKVSSTSGDIKIKGNFYGPEVSTLSGDIRISGESKGEIKSTSGNIKVGVSNGDIKTLSGNIETEENFGNIKTTSGNVVTSTNNKYIKTLSGNIEANENLGIITTLVGNIDIGEIAIKIERNDSSTTSVKGLRKFFSKRSNSIVARGDVSITISSGGKTTTIINGQEVSQGSGAPKTYKVYVNNLCVDYANKEFSVNKQKLSIEQINNNSASRIEVQGENIVLIDRGQKITISKDSVDVMGL